MKKIIAWLLILIILIQYPSVVVFATEASTVTGGGGGVSFGGTEASSEAEEETVASGGGGASFGGTESDNLGQAYIDFLGQDAEFKFAGYMASKLGYVFESSNMDYVADIFKAAYTASGYMSWEEFVEANYDVETNSVVADEEIVQAFSVELNNYIEDTYGFRIYPACKQSVEWVLSHLKYFSAVSNDPDRFAMLFADCNLYFTYVYTINDFWDYTASYDEYIVKERNAFHIYDADLNLRETYHDYHYNSETYEITVNYGSCGYNGAYVNYYYFKNDTKVFNSLAALNDYIFGDKVIFNMSNMNDRITNLNFTVGALQQDWEKINSESLSQILNAIENKKVDLEIDTLTEKQMQEIIDSVLATRLDEIADILNKANDITIQQNQLIYEKLEQIYKLLKEWYSGDEVGEELGTFDFSKLTEYFDKYFALDDDLSDAFSVADIFEDDAPDDIFELTLHVIDSVPDSILGGLDVVLYSSLNTFYLKCEDLLIYLFIPSDEVLYYATDVIKQNLPFIDDMNDFADYVVEQFANEEPPVIRFDFSLQDFQGDDLTPLPDIDLDDDDLINVASETVYNDSDYVIEDDTFDTVLNSIMSDNIVIDFEWYAPYRKYVQDVIAGFMWLATFWKIFISVPKIITGDADLRGGDK